MEAGARADVAQDRVQALNEQEQLRLELDEANRRVAEMYKMASLGRLLAGVVHEINTPISSILSNNEVIVRSLEKLSTMVSAARTDSAAGLDKASEIIETLRSLAEVDKIACERISSVIRGLRIFSRADEADLRKVDLHEILRNTLKLSGCEFRRRVQVETDFGDIPEIECHPHLLSQVFINLLINAGQAIEGEGKVTVRTRLEGDSVHIAISDTGRGVLPEHRDKIFAPGFTTKPVGVGTGLGLSITRKIVVETHNGSIDFESQAGAGTTFHVRLPVRQKRKAEN